VIVVPSGVYLTGTLFLRTNTTLDIMAGATILGSPRLGDYTTMTWGAAGRPHSLALDRRQGCAQRCHLWPGHGGRQRPGFWEPTVPLPGGDGTALTVIPAREPGAERGPVSWIKHVQNQRPSPMIEITNCQDVHVQDIHVTNSAGCACTCTTVTVAGYAASS